MEVVVAAGLAMAAVSAYGQIKTGQAQEANYKSQANMAEFKGRGDAIKYKQQGNQMLKGLVESNAHTAAAAGAGLVKVNLTGSAGTVQQSGTRYGVTNFNMSKGNAITAISMGNMQANIYRAAGKTAARAGIYGAIGTMGSALMTAGMAGGPPGGGSFGATGGVNPGAAPSMSSGWVGSPGAVTSPTSGLGAFS